MSNARILKYLSGFVNRAEDPSALLDLFLENTKSSAGALFVCENRTNHYICITHCCGNESKDDSISLNLSTPITSIQIDVNELCRVSYPITHSMYIPILTMSNYLGVICLFNRKEGYTEELVSHLTPLISLAQLIVQNRQSMLNQSNECKDLFMANMSHEIRTPLNGVIGYNQLLMQTKLNSTQKNYLSSMRQCSIQLMQIINDILDFFKLSSGKMKEDYESFRITDIVQAITDALQQSLQSKKQTLTCRIGDGVPRFIVTDKSKLIQIVMNLVSNAHKFSPIQGEILLHFTCPLSDTLEIRVKDNGVGIAKEDQSKIFRAFEQIQGGSSRIGTGLGLAICRKLSNFLGGDIHVQSELGKGSTFTVNVKFRHYGTFAKEIKSDIKMLKGKKVLVVDDNADNRILLSELLFDWDMQPLMCASALEALRMVQAMKSDGTRRHEFDIGLIDICMPGTGGVELARQIKQELPLFPLIALSSVKCFSATEHFESKLDKPIDKVQLLSSIYRTISNRHLPKAFIGEKAAVPNSYSPSSKFDKDVKILIAEDVKYNSNLLVTMLEKLGYKDVDVAENGQIAIEKLSKAHASNETYEILLLDLRMPIKDGYAVINEHQLRGWALPKIIVVTASVMDVDREQCKKKGIKYFINKPIELSQLNEVMLYVSERL